MHKVFLHQTNLGTTRRRFKNSHRIISNEMLFVPQRSWFCSDVVLRVHSAVTLRHAPVSSCCSSSLPNSVCHSPIEQSLCSWKVCGVACTSFWGRCATRCLRRPPSRFQATGVLSVWPDWWWLSVAALRCAGLNRSSG